MKLQKTLRASLWQPWLGSIQYSPAQSHGGQVSRDATPQLPARLGSSRISPSGRSGWLRCSSPHMRPGRWAVPGGRRSCSSSKLSDVREASTSSRPPSRAFSIPGPSTERRRRRSPCSSAEEPWGWRTETREEETERQAEVRGKETGVGKMRKTRKRYKQGQGQGKTDRERHRERRETERLKNRET